MLGGSAAWRSPLRGGGSTEGVCAVRARMRSVCVARVAQPFARGGSAEGECAVRAWVRSVCVARVA